MQETDYIVQRFKNNDIMIDEKKAELLYRYYTMLVENNKVMNLTAITEFTDVVDKHFIDSAALAKIVDLDGKKVIDIGTGAGFPGIPLKIMFPDMELTLLDSLNKRIGFLNEVIFELGLTNVQAIHSRAEELANRPEHREGYDIAVSRAVSNLSTLVEYCLPYVKLNGVFYSYKGSKAGEEINEAQNAVKVLGGIIETSHLVQIDETDYDRSIVEIRKVSSTPKKYPRSGNKPSTNPLR